MNEYKEIYLQILSKSETEDNFEIDFENWIESIDNDIILNKIEDEGFLFSRPLLFKDLKLSIRANPFNITNLNPEVIEILYKLINTKENITKEEIKTFIDTNEIKFETGFINSISELLESEKININDFDNKDETLFLVDFINNKIVYWKWLIFLILIMLDDIREKWNEMEDFINEL